ncbi:hypothetical protein Ciccas_001884 [Cichlidogyrus casuarinus]|uniref:Uncharacterized protein n=1 Tax=Cichlidogyrus casuarinus TaxID=1844966 RepID=A0ABD2QIT4_9PLAT
MLSNSYLALTNDGFMRYKEPQERYVKKALELDSLEPIKGYYGKNEKVPRILESPFDLQDMATAPVIFRPNRPGLRRRKSLTTEPDQANVKGMLSKQVKLLGSKVENKWRDKWATQHEHILQEALAAQLAQDEEVLTEQVNSLEMEHKKEIAKLTKRLEANFLKQMRFECQNAADEASEVVRRSSQEVIDAKLLEIVKLNEALKRKTKDYEAAIERIDEVREFEQQKAVNDIEQIKRSFVQHT